MQCEYCLKEIPENEYCRTMKKYFCSRECMDKFLDDYYKKDKNRTKIV